ncbi:MAG: glycosyltransferase family 2 protein [Puniceicoccaceae bacterium]
MLDLTIAIPVKNEAKNLPACLEAIGPDLAKEVIVIDSGSTDGTQEIAQEIGVPILSFDWDGKFPKKRNWFLRNHTPSTKWILFLDADEFLTPEFKNELRTTLPNSDKVGYWLNYSIYFNGKPLRGGYPLKKLALFRVGSGKYERIDEDHWSKLDMEIHEHPILQGEIGYIRSRIDHRDLRGPEAWAKKHEEYALWEAKRYLANIANPEIRNQWTLFQKIKYWLMGTPLISPAFFFGCFVLMGGFLDGRRGLKWACMKAGYFAQVYARIQQEKANIKTGHGS